MLRPPLTVMVTAVAPDGGPLPGVEVESHGTPLGETNADGQLTFEITRGIGEEILVSAKLDRPGFQFAPWEERIVIRKWDRSQPETMRYDLEAVLQPVAIASSIRVETEAGPAPGAVVQLDGKTLGKTDENGQLSMELGDRISRSGKLVVRLKGYKPFRDMATLRGDEIFDVSLSRVGVVYATLFTAYETLGRLVPVQGAEVVLAGKSIGTTDASGKLRFASPPRQSSVEVTRDGFLPEPAVVTVQRRSRRQVVVPLYPKEAPVYRIAVLPPKNGKPGDRDVESALPEVEDRLSDYLFSYRCFRRVDSDTFVSQMSAAGISEEQILSKGWEGTPLAGLADVVVAAEITRDNRLIVSLQVISAKGERLGSFRRDREALEGALHLRERLREDRRDLPVRGTRPRPRGRPHRDQPGLGNGSRRQEEQRRGVVSLHLDESPEAVPSGQSESQESEQRELHPRARGRSR